MSDRPLSVLLAESWFEGSHRAWAEGIAAHSRHRVSVLSSEPAGWRRTIQESGSRLARMVSIEPDVVLASSMMDLTMFLDESGLVCPAVLYMHENQLTYDRRRPDEELGLVNWESALRADRVVFNSGFHRDDFLGAAAGRGWKGVDDIRVRSVVLPVGIDPPGEYARKRTGVPAVLWNHRWEADKDPSAFRIALDQVADRDFRLILLGTGASPERAAIVERFGDRVLHNGHVPRPEYQRWLRRADIVVSTARQEFFGVAIAEAMAAGAVPLVPDRLAYPELLGPGLAANLYASGTLPERLAAVLSDPAALAGDRERARRAGQRFAWPRVIGSYDALIASTS